MFTIQYQAVNGEHKMQAFDSRNRAQLAKHLARFDRPIMAVYEQATVITKAMRAELAKMPQHSLSGDARVFISNAP